MACQGRRRRGFSRLSLTGHDGCATPSSWVGASAVACLPSYLSLLLLPCGQGHFGLDFLFAGFLKDQERLNLWVFSVFFIPGTPKDILSYCIGLTRMRFSTWLAISGVARIPSVITSTIGGDALGAGEHGLAVLVFAITLVISGAGVIVYKRLCKKRRGKPEDNSSSGPMPL